MTISPRPNDSMNLHAFNVLLQTSFVIFFVVCAIKLQRVVQRNAGLDADNLAAYARFIDRPQLIPVNAAAGHAVA